MQNIPTEESNNLSYNKNNTTNKQADIVTYRAAFTAKNAKYKCKMQNITTKC